MVAAHVVGMAFPYDNLAIPFAVATSDFGLGREREGEREREREGERGRGRTDTPVAAGRETASINPTSSSLARSLLLSRLLLLPELIHRESETILLMWMETLRN